MRLYLIMLLTLISFSVKGQMSASRLAKTRAISGMVIDSTSQTPLPYVNIVVKDLTDKIIDGGISDDQGNFEIKKVPEGNYKVYIQFMGYKTKEIPVNLSKGNSDLGIILIEEDAAVLNEVEIRAETSTIEQKIDRRVINVGKDLTAAGATAAELLNNVPSVTIDSQSGNVSLRGNENVRVWVDGKPTNVSPSQILQQIPSSSIKSIELITNPSAKYNPEGMSGIINIILHKGARIGFNGNLNSGLTYGQNARFNGSLDLNYKTGKVNLFANYGYNDGKQQNQGYVSREDIALNQNFFIMNTNRSNLLKTGADVYVNDKNTLSFFVTLNSFDGPTDGSVKIDQNETPTFDSSFYSQPKNSTETYNANYKIDFEKEGHNLEFEATYAQTTGSEYAQFGETINPTNPNLNYTNDVSSDRANQIYNIDYTNPLTEKIKLEAGLEARINKTENAIITDQQVAISGPNGFEFEPLPNSDFVYERGIYSAYVNYQQAWEKVSLQVGARAEQFLVDGVFNTDTQSETVEQDIFKVYPSAFLTYNPNEKNQFQVSYSKRVDRPSIQQINPIREWSTPLITSVGNPELLPQFTDSYELNYTRNLKKGSASLGVFYRDVHDVIGRIIEADPVDPEKLILSFYNVDDNARYGMELNWAYKPINWWRFNLSGELYHQTERGVNNGQNIEVINNTFNLRMSNTFNASKKLRLQLFAMYRGANQNIQFDVDPMWMINAGASYSLLKNKASITFRVNDIFQGMKFAFETDTPYPQYGQFNWESRTAYLGFNWRFGSGKNRAKGRKRRDSRETQGGGFM